LSNHKNTKLREAERRRKRLFLPIIYLIAEIVLAWLVLSLVQLEFDPSKWSIWAVVLFIIGIVYSIAKTLHVYKRQKDYPHSNESSV